MSGTTGTRPRRGAGPRRGSTPTFSVVVISRGELEALSGCLSRLAPRCEDFAAELLVVYPGTEPEIARLQEHFAGVRFFLAPSDRSVVELRAQGMGEAAGDIVAITEECDARGEEWLDVFARRARGKGGYGPSPNGASDWPRLLAERGVIGNGTGERHA